MSDMKLQLIISGINSGLTRVLDQSDAAVRRFTTGAAGHFTRLQSHATRVWGAINGASAAAKMIGIGAGLGGMKSVIDENLAFERLLLKMKFNAQMTTRELAEMRKMALDISKATLNSPLEIVQMQFRLATAGLKTNEIRQLAPVIANAAQVFEAPAGEIADLVFDKTAKIGIKNDRVPQMLDMLYYHATSGRFETMDMARQAPELLNAGALVGLNNEAGLNLMGAMTQRMMRNATVQNPAEVATLVKHGLAHITDPHYVKKLGKIGIDVPSYFDKKGHFKGEGGIDGILALTRAMMAHGLENPFKLGKAGFREQYTRTFWLEMMRSLRADDSEKDPNLLKMMERGKVAMDSGQLATNLAVIKQAEFGKIKAASIEIDKAKLSSGGQAITHAAGEVAKQFSESPVTTFAAGVGTLLAGKYLMNKLLAGKGGGLGKVADGMGTAGVVPVLVTNWPGSLTGPMKASERLASLPGRAAPAASAGEAAAAAGGAAALARTAALTAAKLAPVLLLSGDSARKAGNRDEQIAAMDEKMKKLGMRRRPGWLFDSYVPEVPPEVPKAKAPDDKKPGMPRQSIWPFGGAPEVAKPNARAATADGRELGTKRQYGWLFDGYQPGTPKPQAPDPAQAQIATELREAVKRMDALASRPIELYIDGQKVAEAVNKVNGRDARRQ